VLKINPRTHEVTTHFSGLAFPNGFAEDKHGNFYVTDSLLGRIYQFTSEPNSDTVWLEDPALLSINPNQNVGANDLAFDANEDFLYVTNAGNRQVLRIPLSRDGAPAGPIEVFADGQTLDQQLGLSNPTALNFADGLQFDVRGNLFVMSNLTDEIEQLSPDGALIHRYSGTGINAMSFNASPIFKGNQMYITNMSATDGGVNSKVSLFQAPYAGLPLHQKVNSDICQCGTLWAGAGEEHKLWRMIRNSGRYRLTDCGGRIKNGCEEIECGWQSWRSCALGTRAAARKFRMDSVPIHLRPRPS
jgi:sugar lactone lactonase YvrE